MKPSYVALDIETTGISKENSEVLELGAVFVHNGEVVSTFSRLFGRVPKYWEERTRIFNQKLEAEISTLTSSPEHQSTVIYSSFIKWLQEANSILGKRVTFAGKNLGFFDVPILINDIKREAPEQLDLFNSLYQYRMIDIGSLYLLDFGFVPSMEEIAKLIGIEKISHRALQDALAVVQAVEWKLDDV